MIVTRMSNMRAVLKALEHESAPLTGIAKWKANLRALFFTGTHPAYVRCLEKLRLDSVSREF